jgi:pimeloyl-ACP methyl ester carboxylesterase
MGGYITLSFAEKNAKLLAGFGLLNSHCYEDPAAKKANRKKSMAFIKKNGTKVFVKEFYDSVFEPSYKKKHLPLVNAMKEKALKYTPEAVIAATAAMMNRKDKTAVVRKAKVPVLMINGKQDGVVSLDIALKQASLANTTSFHLFDKAKHMSMYEKKKETIAAIRGFAEMCWAK